MFGSLGMPELIVIFVIALLIFGPRKLPELGRSLGRGIVEFRKVTEEFQSSAGNDIRREEPRSIVETAAVATPPSATASQTRAT